MSSETPSKNKWWITAILAPIIVGIIIGAINLIIGQFSKLGELHVQCNASDAGIYLNQELKGKTSSGENFEISSLKPGTYILILQKEGFQPLVFENIKIVAGEITTKLASFVGGADDNQNFVDNGEYIKEESYQKIQQMLGQKKEEIRKTVDSWVQAWENASASNSVQEYSKYYSSDFSSNLGKEGGSSWDYSSWMQDQQQKANKKDWIKVDISNLEIDIQGNEANVAFCQKYESSNYKDEGQKQLKLKSESGDWLIFYEFWTKGKCQ